VSHNFTQPEEIDHILSAMAGHDMEADTPTPHGIEPGKAIQNAGRDDFTRVEAFLYDVVQSKSAHSLSDT